MGVARSFQSVARSLFVSFVQGVKNDLTHQENVFATAKMTLPPKNVARIFWCGKVIFECGKNIIFEVCSYLCVKHVIGVKIT